MKIIMHADDYAANMEVSKNILDCIKAGKLYSVSVLANSPHLFEAMEVLEKEGNGVKHSVHFNLAEGRALTGKRAFMLTDGRGMFNISFFKVLMLSFTPKRSALKAQIKAELRAQLDEYLKAVKVPVSAIRIDSHQHYHMIPLVLGCILECVRERKLKIGFIRVPAESLVPLLRHPEVLITCRPINIVKNLVLNFLALADLPYLRPFKKRTAAFMGMALSGEMDKKRVGILLPEYIKIAEKKGLPLEVLAHPGGVKKENTGTLMDPGNKLCREFYTSKNRSMEKNMILGGFSHTEP